MSAVAHIDEYKTGVFYTDDFRGDLSWNGYEHNNLLKNRVARLVLEVGICSEQLMSRFENVGPQKS